MTTAVPSPTSTSRPPNRKNKTINLSVIKLPNLSIFSVAGEAKDQQMQTNWQEGVLTDIELERIQMKCVEIDPNFHKDWLHAGLPDVVTAKIIGDEAYKRELDALGESKTFMDFFRQASFMHKLRTSKAGLTPGTVDLQAFRRRWLSSIDKWAQEFVEQRNVSKNLSFAES